MQAGRPQRACRIPRCIDPGPGQRAAAIISRQLAGDQNASLVSSGGEAVKRDDAPDTVRVQATLDMNLQSLRAVLYQL